MNILYIRADTYDATPAIPRALIAAEHIFNKSIILSWNRGGTKERAMDAKIISNLFIFNKKAKHRSLFYFILTINFQYWAFKKMMKYDYDVIQALDIESMIPSVVASIIRRKLLIYDIRDPIALDIKSPSNLLKVNGTFIGNLLDKCIYIIDWLLMSMSSGYILPNKELNQYLGRWGRQTKKILYIPNTCYDFLNNLDKNFNIINNSQNVMRMAYLGCMGIDRGSKFLIEFCRNNIGSVELLVAGNIRDQNDINEFENIPNITYLGQLNYIEALTLIKQVDALPILYNPMIKLHKMMYPTKFYESMMVGTPIIVSKGMLGLEDKVIRKNVGYVIDYNDIMQLKNALEKIKINKSDLEFNCRKYFLNELELTPHIKKYRDFYKLIIIKK
jgi:glycosyltransferase involved in cell wall biosynthesis